MATREQPPRTVFTVGYEGKNIDEYSAELVKNGVKAIVDVRKNAISRKNGFSKTKLSNRMKTIGIEYFHLPDLGIPSNLRKDLDLKKPETYDKLFDIYENTILPHASEAFGMLSDILDEKSSVALMCFEADYRFCHRNCLSDKILKNKENRYKIKHL